MTAESERFCQLIDELRRAYVASDSAESSYARLVGALGAMIPWYVDAENLAKLNNALEQAVKNETMKILGKENIHA